MARSGSDTLLTGCLLIFGNSLHHSVFELLGRAHCWLLVGLTQGAGERSSMGLREKNNLEAA